MMNKEIKSVYIHIPFCNHICSYCDFCKIYYNDTLVKKYLKSLKEEINKYYKNEILNTIYIGGGTPSSLKENELKELFNIIKIFKLSKDYEFTFECNINDINDKLLKFLKDNKVNRLSIGVQSFNKKILDNIGRKEIPDKNSLKLAKTYFDNISIDLIYGTNNETLNDLKNDLKEFIKLDMPHISTYSLILEDKSILKVNNYKEQDSDLVRDMYDEIRKELKENGYQQYEISNFSKPGYESKHNLTYWHNERYYGFGLGASGYINDIRYTNTKSINNYIKGNYRYEEALLTEKETMENEMILNLRLIKGINKNTFYNKYHKQIKDIFNVRFLEENKNYYYIKEDNLFISNSILVDFIDI